MNDDGSRSFLYLGSDPKNATVATRLRSLPETTVDSAANVADVPGRLSEADCVVCEYDLPDTDGVAALRRVRRAHPDLAFVLLVRDHDDDISRAAFEAGVTDYVPVDESFEGSDALLSRLRDVADRTRELGSLRSSSELYRLTLSNITDTVFVTDDDGRFTYICPNVHFIFGYTADEVAAMGSVDELLGTDPIDRERLRSEETITNAELAITDANGHEHVLLVTARNVSIGDGTALYSCRDITDRKRVEQRLEAQNTRLQTLVSNAPLALFALDERGICTLSEGRGLARIGFESGELVGDSVFDRFEPYSDVLNAIERSLDGEAVHTEVGIDGVYFELWLQPVGEHSGPDRVIGVAVDVTSRKRQERQLEESRALLERSQELANVGGWVFDVETGELRWTSETRRIHDVPLDYEPAPEDTLDFYHPDDREAVAQQFENCRTNGEPYDDEFRIRTSTGRVRWVRTQGEAVERDGHIVQIRGMIQDVTERKERLQQLRVIGRILRHNLRNDMNVIMGSAENLAMAVDDAELLADVDSVLRKASRLHEIAEKAHDFDELLLQPPGSPRAVELQSVVRNAVEPCRRDHPAADVFVSTLPAVRIRAHASVERALRELVDNAIVHNDRDEPHVDVSAELTGTEVELRIADDGPGIPDREVALLTGERDIDPLYHGTGFGLWVAQWVIHQSGGTIQFTDGDPRGSVVTIRLPLADDA